MLVLTRRAGQELVIKVGDKTVRVRVKKGSAELVIEAPRDVLVLRAELEDK